MKLLKRLAISLPLLVIITLGILAVYPVMLGCAITWILYGSRTDGEPRFAVVAEWVATHTWEPIVKWADR